MRFDPEMPALAKRSLSLLALALLLAAAAAAACTPPLRVVILHTNDLHGQVYPQRAGWLDPRTRPLVGGMSAVASHIQRVRAEEAAKGARVLVIDAGDFFQGTPEGNLPQGRLIVDLLNAMGYDALCLGNHDFDLGPKVTENLARQARFPFLSANILEEGTRTPPKWLKSSIYFPDLKLELLCLTISEIREVAVLRASAGLEFEREERTLERYGWTRPSSGRTRILLAHVSVERARELAAVAKVDAILGGHSHVRAIHRWGNVLYVQAGSKAAHIGRLDLAIDRASGRVVSATSKIELLRPPPTPVPEVQAVLAKYAPEIDRVMNEVVGELAVELSRNHPGRSSPLGSYLCDLMRGATGAEVAFHNRAGIRADLAVGPVRRRDLYQVSPFQNTLVTMNLTGEQVLAVLRHSLSEPRLLLETSGLELEYEPGRILWVRVNGQPLEPRREYRIVTNSFLAKRGDGQEAFGLGREVKDTYLDLLQLHIEDLRKRSPLSYQAPERIRPRAAPVKSASPAVPDPSASGTGASTSR